MFANDVVLCAREKGAAGVGTGTMMEGSLGEERNESVESRDRVYVSECSASRKCQDAHLPHVSEFKYLGSTPQSDGDMNTEVNKIVQPTNI